MEVVRREIIQEPVNEFQKNSPSELLCTISGLIYKSRKDLSWADFEYVYTLREVRIEPGRKTIVNNIILQGKPGCLDFKGMKGLDVLIPVRNLNAEIKSFLAGGWRK